MGVEASSLTWEAPDGALTEDDLAELRAHRGELVAFLQDAQGDAGQAARSDARALIAREAVRLVNGRELPFEECPFWEMPPEATGWPRWLLQQGAWVRTCLWAPAPTVAEVEAHGHENRLEPTATETWPPKPCPPTEAEWRAHRERRFSEEMTAARGRAGLHLRPEHENVGTST